MKNHFVAITVTGPDRPGIIASLTGLVFKSGGNLEDVTMTILEGEFAMILIACFPSKQTPQYLKKQFSILEKKMNLSIFFKSIKKPKRTSEKAGGKYSYLITVSGKDRAGIVYQVSKLLSDLRINITDLNSRIMGTGTKSAYIVLLEADLPSRNVISVMTKRLQALSTHTGLSVSARPLDSATL